ncbi:hypothetical protein GCM10020000_85150 [Streptomyces olivoverticillatus]
MAIITGTAKLMITTFVYEWPDNRCLLAYTSHEGKGVVAAIPDVTGDAPSLWAVAGAHLPTNILGRDTDEERGRWLIFSGWGSDVTRRPRRLELEGEEWTLEVLKTVPAFKEHQYGRAVCGWYGVHTGRLTLKDPELTKKRRMRC